MNVYVRYRYERCASVIVSDRDQDNGLTRRLVGRGLEGREHARYPPRTRPGPPSRSEYVMVASSFQFADEPTRLRAMGCVLLPPRRHAGRSPECSVSGIPGSHPKGAGPPPHSHPTEESPTACNDAMRRAGKVDAFAELTAYPRRRTYRGGSFPVRGWARVRNTFCALGIVRGQDRPLLPHPLSLPF